MFNVLLIVLADEAQSLAQTSTRSFDNSMSLALDCLSYSPYPNLPKFKREVRENLIVFAKKIFKY